MECFGWPELEFGDVVNKLIRGLETSKSPRVLSFELTEKSGDDSVAFGG